MRFIRLTNLLALTIAMLGAPSMARSQQCSRDRPCGNSGSSCLTTNAACRVTADTTTPAADTASLPSAPALFAGTGDGAAAAAAARRWPVRAPFGTTIRCEFWYVANGDTVSCWEGTSVALRFLQREAARCGGMCTPPAAYHWRWRRVCSIGSRRAVLRDA